MYKINEVATTFNISKRTLQYYDKIGLLKPNKDQNNYRIYNDKDIKTLTTILIYKELEIPLKQIKELLKENNKQTLLKKQKQNIKQKINKYQNILKLISNLEGEINMKEIKKVFNEETHNKYQQEAKDKYQNNDLYKQSNKNWNKKTKQQKEETINQGNLIFDNIKNLMQKGIKDIQVQNHIKEYQQYITTNYYNCTNEIYNNLATMYLEDERFKNNLNKIDNNFAQFLSDSIKYYCKA